MLFFLRSFLSQEVVDVWALCDWEQRYSNRYLAAEEQISKVFKPMLSYRFSMYVSRPLLLRKIER